MLPSGSTRSGFSASRVERQPPGLTPLEAMRAASREALSSFGPQEWALIRETTRLTMTTPEVRARAMDEFARTLRVLTGALAKRTGRPADDLAVRTLAGAVVGVMMAATMPWEEIAETGFGPAVMGRLDDALGLLEVGLPL